MTYLKWITASIVLIAVVSEALLWRKTDVVVSHADAVASEGHPIDPVIHKSLDRRYKLERLSSVFCLVLFFLTIVLPEQLVAFLTVIIYPYFFWSMTKWRTQFELLLLKIRVEF